MLIETKECSFAHGLLWTNNLAKQKAMTGKTLHSFLWFVLP